MEICAVVMAAGKSTRMESNHSKVVFQVAGKPIIKARGSAKPEAVVNTAAMLLNMAKNRDVFYGKDAR